MSTIDHRPIRKPAATLPVNLLIDGRACLIVGAGTVAGRKADALLAAGARVTVIAPELGPRIAELRAAGRIVARVRPYDETDLAPDWFLVLTLTSDPNLNRQILSDARKRHLLCACPDRGWPAGDFISPATFRHGDLTVSVSTGGVSCRRARLVKERLARHVAALYGRL